MIRYPMYSNNISLFNGARLAERSKAPDLSSGSLWERGFEPHT